MKKLFFLAILAGITISFSSCGMYGYGQRYDMNGNVNFNSPMAQVAPIAYQEYYGPQYTLGQQLRDGLIIAGVQTLANVVTNAVFNNRAVYYARGGFYSHFNGYTMPVYLYPNGSFAQTPFDGAMQFMFNNHMMRYVAGTFLDPNAMLPRTVYLNTDGSYGQTPFNAPMAPTLPIARPRNAIGF